MLRQDICSAHDRNESNTLGTNMYMTLLCKVIVSAIQRANRILDFGDHERWDLSYHIQNIFCIWVG